MRDDLISLRSKRQDTVDSLPPEWRALVHEYGWGVVQGFWRGGMKPNAAKAIIEDVLRGSSEIRERRREAQVVSPAGVRMAEVLHDLRMPGSGEAIAKALRRRGGLLLPMAPTHEMVEASMGALSRRQIIEWIDTYRKHRWRLEDALAVMVESEMPSLDLAP